MTILLLKSRLHSVCISTVLLLSITLALEFIIFPLASSFLDFIVISKIGKDAEESSSQTKIALELESTPAANKPKAVMSLMVLLWRFVFFLTAILYVSISSTVTVQDVICGWPVNDVSMITLLVCFTMHCSLFLIECFSPRYRLPGISIFSWIHHLALWVNWIIYVSIPNIDDPITISLGFLYGSLIAIFAWSDILQLLRYFSTGSPKWQYRFFFMYYVIKCIQFPAFMVVPLTWVNMANRVGCINQTTYFLIIIVASFIGIPDLILLVTKMRSILQHYRKKSIDEVHKPASANVGDVEEGRDDEKSGEQ